MQLLCWIIQAYIVICFVRVAMSFLGDQGQGIIASFGQLAMVLTEPIFGMVRSKMPQIGDLPIDFSPAIVIIILGILREIVCGLA